MRGRLTATYLALLCLVLLALEVPLGMTLVTRDTQRLAADRLADAFRFASLAEPALRTGELSPIDLEIGRYDQLYDIGVVIVNQDNLIIATSRTDLRIEGDLGAAVRRALAGDQSASPAGIWPWQDVPLVAAVPVGGGGEVTGAVATVSDSGEVRAGVVTKWAALAGVGLLAMLASAVAATALSRWVLKPVTELDAAAHGIASGDHAARVPRQLGPPELRRLTVAFNEMADTVTDSLHRQRMFVAHASHQLRNPLTALRLRVEELGQDITGEDGRAGLESALAETDWLARILDGLLALARAENGAHRLERTDPVGIAESRLAAWQPLAQQREITLSADLPAETGPVRAVATGLSQALDALIDNALKFCTAGDTVRVVVRPVADGVVVRVTDDGPGMSEEQLRHATDRFWRAPDTQNVQGAGLGLPLVEVLVTASGGTLTLETARPHGLDARIWLPAAGTEVDAVPPDREPA
ncbi:HAMP domain-containing sensor histidine kinase [Micromonospora zhanjiangensis]|uniref:histidine kinase n=1 Tax=Micromonospora zhanjiangensis TaxID=1522057 RepID=A0ABV8KSP4_9ACTN